MAEAQVRPIRIALIGAGTVGSKVASLMLEQADDLEARSGAPLILVGVGVKDGKKSRPHIPAELITTDIPGLLAKDIDIVVEVMGGIEPARTYILDAMSKGISVVTANKELLARNGATLAATAEKNNVDLYYEASVAGAIPLLRPLRESLVGDRVKKVLGIVNGTTNYILTKMDETGASFKDALAEAQKLGYAETDPSADIEGNDAAAKAAIVAQLAFHTRVTIDDVYCEGISKVSANDVKAAKEMGFVIKLLAIAERLDEQSVVVRVHPAMIPRSHPLASVREAFNAVFVEAEAAGSLMFYGRGAGGAPTASAVLGDLVAVARNKMSGRRGPGESIYADLKVKPVSEAMTSYYISLQVADKPGVLAQISQKIANNNVSIQTVRQDGLENAAQLIIRTHRALEKDLAKTLDDLRNLDSVKEISDYMRVEGE
ncbi:MAG: homoserine dehydrogenase [Actinomycetota bacterium]|nr:homoserine dehydrogenase [Actinomycetota bacterium]MDA3025939.1 homoserine dehydrogenase [Actinomycetota bacterium]